ncbi:MAG: hypothetical protein ACJ71H_12635 [Nitrososphaeraceae archaeon]
MKKSIRDSQQTNSKFGTSSSSSGETELTDTAYDILKVLGKDADFMIQLRLISEMHRKPIKQRW